MLIFFKEGGKLENPEKNSRSKDENQQQTQPTYDAGSGNRTRDTLVGGERCYPKFRCSIMALILLTFLTCTSGGTVGLVFKEKNKTVVQQAMSKVNP